VQPEILDIFFLVELHVVYMDRGARFAPCGERYVDRLGFVGFHSPFLNQFWIVSRLVCSFYEAMAGSLSMATTAVSLTKVAVIDSGEVDKSAVYSRYNNGPRTLPWGAPALTEDSSAYSVSTFRGSVCYANRILG
jgi:hypothetical protein